MSLTIKEFVIKAAFKEEQENQDNKSRLSIEGNLQALKAEIVNECMEKLEAMLDKKERR